MVQGHESILIGDMFLLMIGAKLKNNNKNSATCFQGEYLYN